MSKVSIPLVRSGNLELDRAIQAIKQNVDSITGQGRNSEKITPLASDATLAQVIEKLNLIIEKLQ